MGYTIKLKCDNCKTEEEYRLGQSIEDCNDDVILSYFEEVGDKKLADKAAKVIDKEESYNRSFEFCLGICEKCGAIKRIPVLSTISNGKKKAAVMPACSCKGRYKILIDQNVIADMQNKPDKSAKPYTKCTCKKCKRTMTVVQDGHWD